MDIKSKLPKPTSSNDVPIKRNFRTICRRSKSMSELRPQFVSHQIQKSEPRVEPIKEHTMSNPTSSKHGRAPMKRPASQKSDDISKAKLVKKVNTVKIPSWDYKTRFQHLTEKHEKLVESLECSNSKLHDFDNMKKELEYKSARLIELEARYAENSFKLEKLSNVESDLQRLRKEHEVLKEDSKELEILPHLKNELANLKLEYDLLRALEREKSIELERLNRVESDLKEVTMKFESANQEVSMLRRKLIDAELMCRKLHNTIQDLKGNIRVFCRVRPPISEVEVEKPKCIINYLDESTIEIGKVKESSGTNGKPSETKAEFMFDRIFPPHCSQTEFFEELSLLVQSAMDGYNVCVFAYGQTGSGKTYTMQGEMSPENLGMIPRSVNLIFETIKSLAQTSWEYTVQGSFLEIYNDNVRDLLDPNSKRNLEICHNEGRGTTVTNLTIRQINSPQDFQNLMMTALKHRVVAATNFNELSSRSHAVTKIYLNGVNKNAGLSYSGSISLVDLAGSESAKLSRPERMAETKCINKSLTALGTVMLALYNKQMHIPYRNSKLTYLLQSSLSGSSKTLMIVNIPPFEENFSESLTSMRFASKVKEVKNSAKRNRPC